MKYPQEHLVCKVDNSVHIDIEGVHARLRSFKIKQEDYYKDFYPRKDLLTQEEIPYKTYEQYFNTYFVNKINARKWFKANPKLAEQLSIQMLEYRIQVKDLATLPSEVELVSCGLPHSQYFYQTLAAETQKLKTPHKYDYSLTSLSFNETPQDIIIDTREQEPWKLKGVKAEVDTLSFGDYAIKGREKEIVIERKSLSDFVSTLVRGYDRFVREFERAKSDGAYIIVLCEESLNTALNYNYIPYFSKYTKIRPEAVFHNVRDIIRSFDCQFVFCDGRVKSAQTCLNIFRLGETVKKIDLQFYLDRAKLL